MLYGGILWTLRIILLFLTVSIRGDINHYTDIITENGGNILKVNWSGMEDDDAIIVYSCPYEKKELIKTALENG